MLVHGRSVIQLQFIKDYFSISIILRIHCDHFYHLKVRILDNPRVLVLVMPAMQTGPAVLYIRDFVEQCEPDPTRPGKGLALQLHISLNIPEKDVLSDDVDISEIPTIVRFFSESCHSNLYQPNVFIYASGSFLTATTPELGFHILLHANTVDR